jgi:hypothetical protein|tara:strand:+ start:401 stop:619 length:219 start_codon:yes stop_codon:yes gene_type:complete
MRDRMYQTLMRKYEAEVADAKFKIDTFVERTIIIPEHIDLTGEIDKLLQIITDAEDKMSTLRQHYGTMESDQ